jgi:hypothetical protein
LRVEISCNNESCPKSSILPPIFSQILGTL